MHISQKGSLLREGIFLRLARALRLPRVVTIHGSSFVSFAKRWPRATRLALRPASAILCLTDETAEMVRRLLPSADVRRVVNAIAVDASTEPLSPVPTACFVGEVGRRKGVDVLVKAWPEVRRRVPDARLLLAGPVPVGADDLLADAVALPGVQYVGVLDVPQAQALMRSSWLLVLPSRAEALPRSLLEAMACGRPVVATAVGDVGTLVDASVGRLAELREDEIANAMATLLNDGDLSYELGSAARRRVEVDYSLGAHLVQLRAIYASLRHRP
ncbi:glycosyltransferase family 4 protein [Blastococcus sp. SYSU D00820]